MGTPRDYYADLELPPSADVQDIKKQFRKLALKYHPDRNPGHEQEVNAKFQIIQSAHEVLSDPDQKAKYDAGRTRSRYPTASGVRGNPWSNVGEQFPPPPRRNGATQNAPSGAQRWQTRFSNGVPPTAKQTASNPEMKKNAARAFEKMSKGNQKPAEPPRPNPPPPPPRTESAKQRAEASFGTRKTGYHPRSAMHGDEPPVTSSNYNTNYNTKPTQDSTGHDYSYPAKPGQAPMPDPLRQFREQPDSRQSSSRGSNSNERTSTSGNVPLSRAKSAREPSRADSSSPDVDTPSRQRSFSVPKANADESDSEEQGPDSPSKFPQEARPKMPLRRTRTGQKHATTDADTSHKNTGEPSIFNIPINDDTFAPNSPTPHPFSRKSTEDINTRFVNDDDPESWNFSAGGSEQDTPTKSRHPPGTHSGRGSPNKRPPVSRSDSSSVPPESSDSAEPGFNAEGWRREFGPHNFAPPPQPQPKAASPSRTIRTNSRKGRPTRMPGAPGADGESSDAEDEELPWPGRKPQQTAPVAAESPQAMDIDSPPSKPATPSGIPADKYESLNVPRNINVEPSRPEWRAGNAEAVNGSAKPQVPRKIPFDANAVGSEDSEEFLASVADLKNVAPFTQKTSGLKSMNDLKDNLPFDSKPSAGISTKPQKAPSLLFPQAPLAPQLPPVALNGRKPHHTAWDKYVKEFEAYLQEWDLFNGRVVDHFATRKANISNSRKEKGYSFLESRSDGAINEYFNWVQQDGEVRRQWVAACDEHEKRFKEFMAFRVKMK